jgi:hypothetical protein
VAYQHGKIFLKCKSGYTRINDICSIKCLDNQERIGDECKYKTGAAAAPTAAAAAPTAAAAAAVPPVSPVPPVPPVLPVPPVPPVPLVPLVQLVPPVPPVNNIGVECAKNSIMEFINNECVFKCTSSQERLNGVCVPICKNGQILDGIICKCPPGKEIWGVKCVDKCGVGQTRNAAGTCKCPVGDHWTGVNCQTIPTFNFSGIYR